MQEGYAIRLNATDGTWENAVRYGSTISDVRNIFMDGNKDIYLCCYRMNATEGITMARWNPTTNELEDKVNLVTGGNAPTCNDAVYSPAGNMIFTAGRGNGAFKFGDITSDAPAGFGAVVSAYSLGTASTVALMNTPSVSYIGETGKAVIKASDATNVRMVNAAGITVYDAEVPVGTTAIKAEPGVYSINGTKILVK